MWREEGVRSQESGVRREEEGRLELSRIEERGKKKGGRKLGGGAFLLVVHCLAMCVTRTVRASCSSVWYSFFKESAVRREEEGREKNVVTAIFMLLFRLSYHNLLPFN